MVIVAVATQIAKTGLMRRAVKALLVLVPVIAACWVVGALVLTMLFMGGQLPPAAAAPAYGCTVNAAQSTTSLDSAQLHNAATIVAVGKQLEVPPYGQTVAIATALQESGLRALDHGHLDSLGLFQQRASWGTAAQRMDPAWSAHKFFTSLLQVPGWQTMPLTVAAQAVQGSGFPDAYAAHESQARTIVGAPSVADAACEGSTGPSRAGSRTVADLVAFGHKLQALGVTVGEHPAFGGVNPVHVADSWHYRGDTTGQGGAIDINYDGHQGGEAAMLDSLVPIIKAAGFRLIWHNTIMFGSGAGTHVAGHEDHAHIDIG